MATDEDEYINRLTTVNEAISQALGVAYVPRPVVTRIEALTRGQKIEYVTGDYSSEGSSSGRLLIFTQRTLVVLTVLEDGHRAEAVPRCSLMRLEAVSRDGSLADSAWDALASRGLWLRDARLEGTFVGLTVPTVQLPLGELGSQDLKAWSDFAPSLFEDLSA